MLKTLKSLFPREKASYKNALKKVTQALSFNSLVGFSRPNILVLGAVASGYYLLFEKYLSNTTLNYFYALTQTSGVSFDVVSTTLVTLSLFFTGLSDVLRTSARGEKMPSIAMFALKHALLPFRFAQFAQSTEQDSKKLVINPLFFASAAIVLVGAGSMLGNLYALLLLTISLFQNNYLYWQLTQASKPSTDTTAQPDEALDWNQHHEAAFGNARKYFFNPFASLVTIFTVAFSLYGPNLLPTAANQQTLDAYNKAFSKVMDTTLAQHPLGNYPLTQHWLISCDFGYQLMLRSNLELNNSDPSDPKWSSLSVKLDDSCPIAGIESEKPFNPVTAKIDLDNKISKYSTVVAHYYTGYKSPYMPKSDFLNIFTDKSNMSFLSALIQNYTLKNQDTTSAYQNISKAVSLSLDAHAIRINKDMKAYTRPYTITSAKTNTQQNLTLNPQTTPKVPVVQPPKTQPSVKVEPPPTHNHHYKNNNTTTQNKETIQ